MRLILGDALSTLKTLDTGSIQCVVTSPPYWGLRRYDVPDIVFPDGWSGQLGQEALVSLYVQHLVEIFREVRRVLRKDGTLWLNMGDCYYSGNKGGDQCSRVTAEDSLQRANVGSDVKGAANTRPQPGLKEKDLVGLAWEVAFALRRDGWYLRAENIWAKGVSFDEDWVGSVMPQSVLDRPTRSHEQVFLLTKHSSYYYDSEGVKEPGVHRAGTRAAKGSGTREGNRRGRGYAIYNGTRHLRTVWTIAVKPCKEAHFATFPVDLATRCLKAGASVGACATCAAPLERIVHYEPLPHEVKAQFEAARERTAKDRGRDDGCTANRPTFQRQKMSQDTWEPSCNCPLGMPPVPCVVLDPFMGSGTVGVACAAMGLEFIGIDLGRSYLDIARRRAPLFLEVEEP